jgi:hypothetical protein
MPGADDTKKDAETEEKKKQAEAAETIRAAIVGLLHPIPLTVLLILISVFVLMYPTVFSNGGDVLTRMADHEFARGLITYLFAVTTIGTAVVLVMAALAGRLSDEQLTRGKDILALLLGVFGTIVGFYFGAEAHSASPATAQVSLTQPLLLDSLSSPGDTVRLTAYVSGGATPYTWGFSTSASGDLDYNRTLEADGWIVAKVALPRDSTVDQVPVRLGVRDRTGRVEMRQAVVRMRPTGRRP